MTLTFPDPRNPLALSCDASDKAVGGVLEEFQDGAWRPIGLWSKHLSKSKQNWSVFRRELYGIQAALRNFLPDVYGRDLIIFTDHRSILGAMANPNFVSNDPVATRALLEISQYTHDIRYRPGKAHLSADALSRPDSVPPGDAYMPEVDAIAAAKELITLELQPEQILLHQNKSDEVKNHLIEKSSPKTKTKIVDFRGHKLLCDVTNPDQPKPFIPSSLRPAVFQACHNLDHAPKGVRERRRARHTVE